jgi:hypothetical protein
MGPQNPSKMAKIVQNGQFSGCHGYENDYFRFFSFDPNRTWLDGPFGVLHDLLYASIDVKEPWNGHKWQKMHKMTYLGFLGYHSNHGYHGNREYILLINI